MIKFPKKYTMELDEQVKAIIRKDIARKGIESYISTGIINSYSNFWY